MERDKAIVRTGIIGIIINVVLAAVKILIGYFTNSVAVVNDGLNNLVDSLSAAIVIVGTKLSSMKATKKYPFGFGRIEYISAVVIAALVIVAGASGIDDAVMDIITDSPTEQSMTKLIILIVALAAKLGLGFYYLHMARVTNSASLKNSGVDCMSDSVLSASTVAAAIISMTLGYNLDGLFAIIISLAIIKTGIGLLIESMGPVIGQRRDAKIVANIKRDVVQYPGVLGVYDMVVHDYGKGNYIGSMHIELPDDTRASEIHRLSRLIEEDLYLKHGIIFTVGIYASNNSDPSAAALFDEILGMSAKYKGIKQVHGFYVDWERQVISFDLVIDFDQDSQPICNGMREELQASYPDYRIDIIADKDY